MLPEHRLTKIEEVTNVRKIMRHLSNLPMCEAMNGSLRWQKNKNRVVTKHVWLHSFQARAPTKQKIKNKKKVKT